MSKVALTLEAVKEQFYTADKRESLEKMQQHLDDAWSIDEAAKLTAYIGEDMEKQIKENGLTWAPGERILRAVCEAFILGSLDMAEKFMVAADMSYEALAGEQRGDELENPS